MHERIDNEWINEKKYLKLVKGTWKNTLGSAYFIIKVKKDVIWASYDLNWRKLYGYNKILYVQVDSTLYVSLFRIFNAANSTLWTFCLVSWE